MAKTPPTIEEYMAALDHPLKDVVDAIRQTVLHVSDEVEEQVKWNSPAFCYTGPMADFDPKTYKRDLLVLHLRKKDEVLLVFPTGAVISDASGFLQGNYSDGRKMATIRSLEELASVKTDLQAVVKDWLSKVDK